MINHTLTELDGKCGSGCATPCGSHSQFDTAGPLGCSKHYVTGRDPSLLDGSHIDTKTHDEDSPGGLVFDS
jgi:hypothetical protein